MRRLALSAALALGLLAVPTAAQETDYAPARIGQGPLDAEREARVMRLGKELRCAVCQGVSIADSPASMARAQLDKVRELVAENKTDQEIRDYFVARYGEWALLEPKKEGLNSVLWFGPGAILVVGVLLIFAWSKRKPAPRAPVATPASPAQEDDEFLKKVREDLSR